MMNEDQLEYRIFESKFYTSQSGIAQDIDPLQHYLDGGWREFDPHPLFSNSFYLSRSPDVASANVDPLTHWTMHGWKESRSFHPFFDIPYYLSQIHEKQSTNPLQHYLDGGWREFDPHPLFSTVYYLATNADVVEANLITLEHFLTSGGAELRKHHPLFDPVVYKQLSGTSEIPVLHFLKSGGFTDTTPLFNTQWYLERNPDARQSTEIPIVHWLKYGHKDGYLPNSHPISEFLSEVLIEDPVAATLLAELLIPNASIGLDSVRILPFHIDKSNPFSPTHEDVADIYVSGDLPAVVSSDGQLLYPETWLDPFANRNPYGYTVFRHDQGLTAGVFKNRQIKKALVPIRLRNTESTWLLQVLPELIRIAPNFPNLPIVSGNSSLRPHIQHITEFCLPDNELIFLNQGDLQSVETAILIHDRDKPKQNNLKTLAPDRQKIVLLFDEDDDLPGESAEFIAASCEKGEMTIADTRWHPSILLKYLEDATTVISSRGLAVALFFATPQAEVIGFVDGMDPFNFNSLNFKQRIETASELEKNETFAPMSLDLMSMALGKSPS